MHMRNCSHKCNRTQVRPATNEEAKGIEIVSSLLPNLTEAVREGRTRHFADITDEDDEPMVVEGDVMDVRLGGPDSQLEPELNAPANSNAHHTVTDQKPTRSPRPRSRLSRDIIWTYPRIES